MRKQYFTLKIDKIFDICVVNRKIIFKLRPNDCQISRLKHTLHISKIKKSEISKFETVAYNQKKGRIMKFSLSVTKILMFILFVDQYTVL